MNRMDPPPTAAALRSRAEAAFQEQATSSPETLEALSPEAARRMLHELQVQRIELEMQNEELRHTQRELDIARERYFDLYNMAPVGYLTMSQQGLIRETNLTAAAMLGVARGALKMHPLSQFIFHADQDHHYLNFKALFETGAPAVWELRLVKMDESYFWARLEATVVRSAEGGPECRVVMSDISDKKRVEETLEKTRRLRAEIEQIGKVGGWELDLETNRLAWTEEIHRIVEVDPTYEPTVDDGTAFYTPASKPVIALAVRRAIELGEPYDLELEITTAKGNLKAVHSIGRADLAQGRLYGFFQDITERKQSEQALRELHEMFRAFTRHTPIMSYILAVTPDESRILHASDNYEQFFGKPMAEILGKTTTEFFPPEVAARMHDADLQTMTSGVAMQTEQKVNGRTYHVIKFPIVQGSRVLVAGFTIDITEQRQAERTLREWNQTLEDRVTERTRELQQSEARFRQLAETTFEGIAISQDGRLIDGNAQLGKMHGYELAEMIGRPLLDFVAPESRAKVAENILLGQDITYEGLSLRQDGSTFPTEFHGRMGSWHGRKLRITALRDLTESKRLAASFQTQQTALEHAQRLALISEVCAGIVHQISQPLCAMGANLAVIQARLAAVPESCGETLEILREIIDSVACIRNVMHHMRALLHPEQPNHLPTDLHRVLEEVLPLLRQEADHRGICLTVELGADLPAVLADAVQLHQVVLNLTRNAFDACAACPPDRRLVVITTHAIAGTAVELCVRDTGIGIAPGIIDHLFAPFFTTTTGMGIGLRLSRTIIEAHGGSIEASNNADGIGATFCVSLPSLTSPSTPTS